MPQEIRLFSYGGGVQSTAALVLAAQRRIDFPLFIFCNVGADSENPATLDYIETHAAPFAEEHAIELKEVARTFQRGPRKGEIETVYGRLTRPNSRSLPIPVRMSNGAPGNRACTVDFKIDQTERIAKALGATADNKAIVGIGISTDEIHRMTGRDRPYERLRYPLIDLGLNRNDCMQIIRSAGLPVPPKSSCYFCPFHSIVEWQRMKHEQPDLFEKAADLEQMLNQRRAKLGKDPVWLTRRAQPLKEAIGDQLMIAFERDDEADCNSGYCMV